MLLLVFICLSAAKVRADDMAYGAYGLYPAGSTRVLAMGGAFVGLADDASAVVTNPAGLSLSRYTFDFSGGQDRVVNRESYFGVSSNPSASQREGLPYTAQFRALALRLGWLGLGASYSVPYSLNREGGPSGFNTGIVQTLTVESYDLALSVSLLRSLSLGVTAHSERVLVGYTTSDHNRYESKKDSVYPTVGLLFDLDRKASLGVTYSPERKYDIDETLDTKLGTAGGFSTTEWFHDVVIPSKISLGLSYEMRERLRWVGDIDVVMPVKNAMLVGGSQNSYINHILEEQQTVIHGGFEFLVKKSKELDFTWRGGGYNEPKRIELAENRLHFTMGVEVRLWFLVFAASYDQAQDFSNVAQSVGINLGEI